VTDDEHGEHVFVRAVQVLGDARPAWAFHCGLHDEYGTVRLDYSAAVSDGQGHVYGEGDDR
jgi:hypothetical protein